MGIDAIPVEVEVRVLRGQMGRFLLTGLPGAAVREARDRVRSAITASGFQFPKRSILVHLAPGDLKKDGPLLDLSIALAILEATDQLTVQRKGPILGVGELSLDGRVRNIPGGLAIAAAAQKHGFAGVLLPPGSSGTASMIQDPPVFTVETLQESVAFLSGHLKIARARTGYQIHKDRHAMSLTDVRGQQEAIKALAVAAAGGHNLLMIGPPGSGKTMLARRFADLLPDLEPAASLEVTLIHNLMRPSCTQRITRPPFRAPHHTASPVSLIGGGPRLRPGEISLAHKGVLFLDELPEFPRHVIETLRQPLEDRYVTISRAVGTAVFPADISLVAAMNPCPCGYRGHRSLNCHCSESSVRRYMRRISGPMLDRIDLCVEVPAVDVAELIDHPEQKDSCEITSRIQQARNRQTLRFGQQADHLNALIPTAHTSKWCRLPPGGRDLLIRAAARHRISARAVDRLIRVARTVADLRDAESIGVDDLAFALSCRTDLVDLA